MPHRNRPVGDITRLAANQQRLCCHNHLHCRIITNDVADTIPQGDYSKSVLTIDLSGGSYYSGWYSYWRYIWFDPGAPDCALSGLLAQLGEEPLGCGDWGIGKRNHRFCSSVWLGQ